MTPGPLLLTLALVAGACAGQSSYQVAMADAQAAHDRGDYAAAATHYSTACTRSGKPDDPACQAARDHTEYVRQTALAAGAAPCRAGDIAACTTALLPARQVTPDDPQLLAMLNNAGDAYATRCTERRDNTPAGKLRYLRCLMSAADSVGTKHYTATVSAARADAAALFERLATQPALANQHGARLLLWDAAVTLGSQQASAGRDQAWHALVTTSAVPLEVTLASRGPGSPAGAVNLCADLVTDARTRCGAGQNAIPIAITVELTPMSHSARTEQRTVRYLAGTRSDPNPAYRPALHQVTRAQRAVRHLERELVELELECDAAGRAWWDGDSEQRPALREHEQTVCARYKQVQEVKQRRDEELADAERTLRSTPAVIEEQLYDLHHWTAILHRWHSDFQYRIEIAGTVIDGSGQALFTAEEQPGFAAGAIAQRTLDRVPTQADAYQRARVEVVQRSRAALAEQLVLRATERAAYCPNNQASWTPQWLQCHAEAAVLATGQRPSATDILNATR